MGALSKKIAAVSFCALILSLLWLGHASVLAGIVYYDAHGNVISEEEYHKLTGQPQLPEKKQDSPQKPSEQKSQPTQKAAEQQPQPAKEPPAKNPQETQVAPEKKPVEL